MANMPAFQASDESSILSARTKLKTMSEKIWFLIWYDAIVLDSHHSE